MLVSSFSFHILTSNQRILGFYINQIQYILTPDSKDLILSDLNLHNNQLNDY